MNYKYRIDIRWLKAEIKPVEFVKETEVSVWLAPDKNWINSSARRSAKISDYYEYHDTWELAHEALKEKAHERLIAARRALEVAQSLDGNVRGMKP